MTSGPGQRAMGSRWWLLLLAGPVIWYLHFWIVYLVAEGVCTLMPNAGAGFLVAAVAGASAIAIAAILLASRLGRTDEPAGMALISRVQLVIFVLGVIAVAAPMAFFPPC